MTLIELTEQIKAEDRLAFAELKWLYTDVYLLKHEEHMSTLGEMLEHFAKKYGTIFIRNFEQAMNARFGKE